MSTADPAVAELIREVLAEEMARLRPGVREERVRIASDADLAAFAKRVLALAGDRAAREAFENGNLVFRLDAGAGAAVPSSPAASGPPRAIGHTEVIERGLLSEREVDRLPRETARVCLGRNVTVTPLARDRLRRRGIAIERAQ